MSDPLPPVLEDKRTEAVASLLSPELCKRLCRVQPDEQFMGGFFGLAWIAPEAVEKVGINHPIFGSHYRLTPLGLAVRAYLQLQARQP